MVSNSFNEVSRIFEISVKGVPGKFEGCLMAVSIMFQESFKGV